MFLPPLLTTPLLKIPLVLSGATFVHLATTPPTDPPKSHEVRRFEEGADTLSQYSRRSVIIFKATVWLGALSETILILAERAYPAAWATRVLSEIPDPYAPSRLRLSAPFLLGWALLAGGAALRRAAYRTLGRLFTWELALRDGHALCTAGPYATVRHPGYAAILAVLVGNALCAAAPGGVWRECWVQTWAGAGVVVYGAVATAVTAAMLVGRVAKEDEALRRAFGTEWEEWAARTPYQLVPFVY
ncbi:hypothetical protein CERSUDRAFT_113112 [Gelatoporia subvermispora B]|uniref:Protein-S-isoprenylcysteine O-methyltransferase n=1 Tax=Ceriporiopsis subvermispora (strain B) TaxID=914234 RepID=M2R0G9_CERS8|nr:hypothetical protein CERSUDRAFT_113112 [Gelatoporia subvermispora B]